MVDSQGHVSFLNIKPTVTPLESPMGFNTPVPMPIDKLDVKDIVKKAQIARIDAM